MIWAGTYALVDAAPPGTDLVYFAFSNYTTLGYGNVLPEPHRRLLGPMTALNGILLIGWSTALVFAIIRRGLPAGPGVSAERFLRRPLLMAGRLSFLGLSFRRFGFGRGPFPRPSAGGLGMMLAIAHAFELDAVGIEEEHREVVVVIFVGRIDDGVAELFPKVWSASTSARLRSWKPEW